MTSLQSPTYPKGDLRRMLMVLAAIEAAPGVTVVRIAAQTHLSRKTVDDLIRQAVEQAAVCLEKEGSGYRLTDWGPVFNPTGARKVLTCALNARMMTDKSPAGRDIMHVQLKVAKSGGGRLTLTERMPTDRMPHDCQEPGLFGNADAGIFYRAVAAKLYVLHRAGYDVTYEDC